MQHSPPLFTSSFVLIMQKKCVQLLQMRPTTIYIVVSVIPTKRIYHWTCAWGKGRRLHFIRHECRVCIFYDFLRRPSHFLQRHFWKHTYSHHQISSQFGISYTYVPAAIKREAAIILILKWFTWKRLPIRVWYHWPWICGCLHVHNLI
jgi:hypothetical protein